VRKNHWQIIVQSEIALDKICVRVFKLEGIAILPYPENLFSGYAVPPTVFLVPSERLSAAESEIQVEWSQRAELNPH
jgi:hypothetical protein